MEVAPVVVPCIVVDEVHFGILLHVFEVVVVTDGVGDEDVFVAFFGSLLESEVVVHGFGEEEMRML